jgi:pre-mRNA-splicing factor 18
MDKLKNEIARKKSTLNANTTDEINIRPRFQRRGDVEQANQKLLEEEQQKLDERRNFQRNQQLQEEEELRNRLQRSSKEVPPIKSIARVEISESQKSRLEISLLNLDQLHLSLRSLGRPIRLFGESEEHIKERLFQYIIQTNLDLPISAKVYNSAISSGSRKREALSDNIPNTATHEDINNGSDSDSHPDESEEKENEDDDDDEQPTHQKKRHRVDQTNQDQENKVYFDPTIQYHKRQDLTSEQIVYKFFRSLIKQWESDLQQRPDQMKNNAKGREEVKSFKRCKDYIRPLFRLCKENEVPPDILVKLVNMVKACEEGNFVKAHDEYMRTAIGNSAWPMGLTMVGIHERSGRERISTAKVSFL